MTKHTINLREGDYAKLQAVFFQEGGAAFIIRKLVSQVVDKLERDDDDQFKEDLKV